MSGNFIPGLELSASFYAEVVAPILSDALGEVPHSAALLGWGSEVQGLDTARSTDHAWGPRLRVFVTSEESRKRADSLDGLLEQALPATYRGYPVRFPFPDGAPARHWVQATDITAFFAEHLGVDISRGELSTGTWLTVPTQVLRELTGGRVYHDGLGLLTRYRATLAWYPDDVWRYILACQWLRLSAEEPFIGRCGEVGDELGSAVVAARQVRDVMKLCLLMDRVYPPYSKWLGTSFAALPCAPEMEPALTAALAARGWPEREASLSVAYEAAARIHNELGLTEPVDPHVRRFHTRPFMVLDAHRFTEALMTSIGDPAIRELPQVGAIDQYVDSSDLLDREAAAHRRRYIRGPGGVS